MSLVAWLCVYDLLTSAGDSSVGSTATELVGSLSRTKLQNQHMNGYASLYVCWAICTHHAVLMKENYQVTHPMSSNFTVHLAVS